MYRKRIRSRDGVWRKEEKRVGEVERCRVGFKRRKGDKYEIVFFVI